MFGHFSIISNVKNVNRENYVQSGGEKKALIKGSTYSDVQGFKKIRGAQFLIHSPNVVSWHH